MVKQVAVLAVNPVQIPVFVTKPTIRRIIMKKAFNINNITISWR